MRWAMSSVCTVVAMAKCSIFILKTYIILQCISTLFCSASLCRDQVLCNWGEPWWLAQTKFITWGCINWFISRTTIVDWPILVSLSHTNYYSWLTYFGIFGGQCSIIIVGISWYPVVPATEAREGTPQLPKPSGFGWVRFWKNVKLM